jgi:hypothetical protein
MIFIRHNAAHIGAERDVFEALAAPRPKKYRLVLIPKLSD